MHEDRPPEGLTPIVADDWRSLTSRAEAPRVFRAGMTSDLPEPVCRWLTHAIAEGTPLTSAVEVRMHGEIFLGRWSPFTAVQRLSVTGGFVWAATARLLGLPIRGFDRWTRGTGEMRWRLFGIVPVASAGGPDVTRSAAGRHVGELLVALPPVALSPEVRWHPLDGDRAAADVRIGEDTHQVTVTVGAGGALTGLGMRRWGPVDRKAFGMRPFGATFAGELAAGGLRVPEHVTAGYGYGTDRWEAGQFIRWTVDDLRPC